MVHVEKTASTEVPERPSKGAWVVAWSAFAAGIGASLAANIAHAGDGIGEKFVAGWPPLALLLCSEVMMRVPAPRHPPVRALQIIGTVVVAGVAAVASYRHMKALALEYGEDNLTASTLPLSVDGLALVASIALVVLAHQRRDAIAAERTAALAVAAPRPVPMPLDEPALAGRPAAAPDSVPRSAPGPVPDPLPEVEPQPAAEQVSVPSGPDPMPRMEPVVPPVPWPQQQPLPVTPPPVPSDAATEELWAAARRAWRDSAAAGEPLTGKALGKQFGRGERWGRDRIAEAKAERNAEEAGGDVGESADRAPAGAGIR
ncbi:DUF2637 domain-containing protein [Micromonospora sp. WMMD1082]|uniref:DUF2637 domain-containing protein n=1 Tax=Micromonospora sp. WMMD1082 TaxID=3016104 RepID=UPI0024169E75|nr:DUF2637 domain-containing protein [Micromonospora sp. WMMD1082]MDG4796975.1 DUF2637 domain-containing protein [Micromonospora sp. WMMD1082]